MSFFQTPLTDFEQALEFDHIDTIDNICFDFEFNAPSLLDLSPAILGASVDALYDSMVRPSYVQLPPRSLLAEKQMYALPYSHLMHSEPQPTSLGGWFEDPTWAFQSAPRLENSMGLDWDIAGWRAPGDAATRQSGCIDPRVIMIPSPAMFSAVPAYVAAPCSEPEDEAEPFKPSSPAVSDTETLAPEEELRSYDSDTAVEDSDDDEKTTCKDPDFVYMPKTPIRSRKPVRQFSPSPSRSESVYLPTPPPPPPPPPPRPTQKKLKANRGARSSGPYPRTKKDLFLATPETPSPKSVRRQGGFNSAPIPHAAVARSTIPIPPEAAFVTPCFHYLFRLGCVLAAPPAMPSGGGVPVPSSAHAMTCTVGTCPQRTSNCADMARHITTHFRAEVSVPCAGCPMRFAREDSYVRHLGNSAGCRRPDLMRSSLLREFEHMPQVIALRRRAENEAAQVGNVAMGKLNKELGNLFKKVLRAET